MHATIGVNCAGVGIARGNGHEPPYRWRRLAVTVAAPTSELVVCKDPACVVNAGRHKAKESIWHVGLALMVPPPTPHAATVKQCAGMLTAGSDGQVPALFPG